MPDEFVIDFPTLGDLGDAWITRHCRVPDGFTRGKAFQMADWQFWCHANRYRVREGIQFVPPERVGPDEPPVLNQAFFYRMTMIVAPQKTGKGPFSASQVAFEACGPSVFAGWAKGGEVYSCADNGCMCGWEDSDQAYVYQAGEPLGMRHPSPLIQITANSEDQAANIYRPLTAMIRLGPLKHLLAVREGFIRILGLSDQDDFDRIDVVTASARSRLGNPISDAEQDEAGLYTKQNKMIDTADTQARGAAGMGGRTHLTSNAWNPAENSYAQQIYEAHEDDVFVFYRDPDKAGLVNAEGKPLKYTNVKDRRRIHEYVYEGSWWVNLDSIEALAVSLMKRDPAQAERFFGNRLVAGAGKWLADGEWEAKKAVPFYVTPRTAVALGFDGSDNDDFTGIRLETLDTNYQFTPTFGPLSQKTLWNPADFGGRIPRDEVMVAFRELFAEYDIVRGYFDPPMWQTEIDTLASLFGTDRVIQWPTYRPVPMHEALERFKTDLAEPHSKFTHDNDPLVAIHMENAVVRARDMDPLTRVRRYILGKPMGEQHRKIDYAMSSVLAHEAAMDVLASGWKPKGSRKVTVYR